MKKENTDFESVDLENQDVYWYHNESESYKFDFTHVPGLRQVLSVPASLVDKFVAMYSNHTGKGQYSVRDIANYFETDENVVKYILRVMEVTHSDAISTEQLKQIAAEECSDEQLDNALEQAAREQIRLGGMKRAVKTKTNRLIMEKAEKWDKFQEGIIDPWADARETLSETPIKVKKVKRKVIKNDNHLPTAVVCLSDIHFGDALKTGMVFNGKPFDATTIEQRVEEYAEYVVDLMARNMFNSREIHVFCLGDLIDSLTGLTDKGTKLGEDERRGHDLFKRAVRSFYSFLARLSDACENVHIHCVGGNHDSVADANCIFTASERLIGETRLKEENVHIHESRLGSTYVDGTYILFEHGYSAKYRHKTPPAFKKRVEYVTDYMLQDPAANSGNRPRIFLQGDTHHEEYVDCKSFSFVKVSALVNANHYSAENAYDVKPSQAVIGVDKTGIVCRYTFRPSDAYDEY